MVIGRHSLTHLAWSIDKDQGARSRNLFGVMITNDGLPPAIRLTTLSGWQDSCDHEEQSSVTKGDYACPCVTLAHSTPWERQ
jgi:hypothetical protein